MTGRRAALEALRACRRNAAWSDAALSGVIKSGELPPREAALASRICYGVVQNTALCDYYISRYLNKSINRLEPTVLDILRMGVYQIAMMDKIPVSAAVNESVKLAKQSGASRSAGLINAVLRKFANSPLPEIDTGDETEDISIRFSHPRWLTERICDIIGVEGAKSFFACNNSAPPVAAQVNTLRTDIDNLRQRLEQAGIACDKHYVPNCLILSNTGSLDSIPEFNEGHFYIQDPAAAMAVMAAGLKPGMRVLDGCAAPGGKTFACAIAMENSGTVVSCDIHGKKLKRISDGAARLGIDIVETVCRDSRQNTEEYNGEFDAVIADVPCSGLGVIRKKPEIRYKKPEEIAALPGIQLDILKNLSRYVKAGGVLIYSTCTVLPEENEGVIQAFLSQNGEFKMEGFKLPEPVGAVSGGMVTLWSHIHDTDGFFICKLRRIQ
ncbi:MAG: 16S rRNA (cytosine(967)-C(5))-methyltransferase RsmB [Oscillospiraceae bacterium]|nr:16S rRNA (cytosine(967)-C(5))-methyltransferase RsmB [Oscillospiraceae bacterium]